MADGRRRTAILISGRGSNMATLIEAAKAPGYPAEIALVVASTPEAAGLETAASAGIETDVVRPGKGDDKPACEEILDRRLKTAGIDLICLAGYMHVLSGDFVERWRGRMINIHPSLLPLFPGLDTHARALRAGVRLHGCTVHFVVAEVDAGPIVAQAAVGVASRDTAETLAARVLRVEHLLYPHALALVASGRVRIDGDHAVDDGTVPGTEAYLASPPLG